MQAAIADAPRTVNKREKLKGRTDVGNSKQEQSRVQQLKNEVQTKDQQIAELKKNLKSQADEFQQFRCNQAQFQVDQERRMALFESRLLERETRNGWSAAGSDDPCYDWSGPAALACLVQSVSDLPDRPADSFEELSAPSAPAGGSTSTATERLALTAAERLVLTTAADRAPMSVSLATPPVALHGSPTSTAPQFSPARSTVSPQRIRVVSPSRAGSPLHSPRAVTPPRSLLLPAGGRTASPENQRLQLAPGAAHHIGTVPMASLAQAALARSGSPARPATVTQSWIPRTGNSEVGTTLMRSSASQGAAAFPTASSFKSMPPPSVSQQAAMGASSSRRSLTLRSSASSGSVGVTAGGVPGAKVSGGQLSPRGFRGPCSSAPPPISGVQPGLAGGAYGKLASVSRWPGPVMYS